MSVMDRRRFLHGRRARRGRPRRPPAAEPPAAKDEDKKPKFRLGLVTYNLAANWDLPSLLKACSGHRRFPGRAAHHSQARRRAVAGARTSARRSRIASPTPAWTFGAAAASASSRASTRPSCRRTSRRASSSCSSSPTSAARASRCGPTACRTRSRSPRRSTRSARRSIPCGKAADDAGIEIWVEVHGQGTAHPPYMKTIMEACGHPKVGLTWNSNPQDVQGRVRGGVFQAVVAVGTVMPYQRTLQGRGRRVSLPGTVPPLPRERLRPRDDVRGRQKRRRTWTRESNFCGTTRR